jgi:predicted AAA+ superfamily ATPase
MEKNEEDPYFERKVYSEILDWQQNHHSDVLFLKGARRVGKTTLAEKVGEEKYRSHIRVSFDKASDTVKDLFVNHLEDLDYFFSFLQAHYRTVLYPHESLIILDEIQLFPPARQALKTLLEDGRYDYIETGSTASIAKSSGKILIPSEEWPVDVHPLDFEEFLWALGDRTTFPIIRLAFQKRKPLGKLVQEIMLRYRQYLLIGGMPQSIKAYVAYNNYSQCENAKKKILALYRESIDAQTYVPAYKVRNILDAVPSELNKHDKRFMLSHLKSDARLRDYATSFQWLSLSKIINQSFNAADPSAAINLSVDDDQFKCFLVDTGLFITLAFGEGKLKDEGIYEKILKDKLHLNEGMVLENAVAQALVAHGHPLFFYERLDSAKKKIELEIDFQIIQDGKVSPVEVKSSSSDGHDSIDKYKKRFPGKIGTRYLLYDGDIQLLDGDLLYLPYFMGELL